jgi:hypothetical protein
MVLPSMPCPWLHAGATAGIIARYFRDHPEASPTRQPQKHGEISMWKWGGVFTGNQEKEQATLGVYWGPQQNWQEKYRAAPRSLHPRASTPKVTSVPKVGKRPKATAVTCHESSTGIPFLDKPCGRQKHPFADGMTAHECHSVKALAKETKPRWGGQG